MNKLLIALLLAVSLSAIHAATNNCDGNDPNCASTTAGTTACPTAGGVCAICKPTYGVPATAGVCGQCPTHCNACDGGTNTVCSACVTSPTTYYLDATPTTPICTIVQNCKTSAADGATCLACKSGFGLSTDKTKCTACTDPKCTTCDGASQSVCTICSSGGGYGLAQAASSSAGGYCIGCVDNNCASCSNPTATCSICNSGFYLGGSPQVCTACPLSNCATCSSATTCTLCAAGYAAPVSGACTVACTVSNCYACLAVGKDTCDACYPGYTLTGGKCVAQTVTPQSASPSSSAFNVSAATVFTSTETTTFAGLPYTSQVVYGPGTDDSVAYVWGVSTAGSTLSVIRRALNATYGSGLAKSGSNTTTDTTISTSVATSQFATLTAVGPGVLGFLSYVSGGDISLTYIVNGTSASTKGVTGNTDGTVFLKPLTLGYDTGVFYTTFVKYTHTPGTSSAVSPFTQVAPTQDSWVLNGIYIQGINATTGTTIYNGTAGGVKAIPLSATGGVGLFGANCQLGVTCASAPSLLTSGSQVYNFALGFTNLTNSTTANYLWHDASGTVPLIKTGTITLATGAATTAATLTTDVATTGAKTVASPAVTVSYSIGGFLGSSATTGVFVTKTTKSDTGAAASASNPSYTYAVQAYINGSTTAAGNVTVASGYGPVTITGYGVSDGFVLMERQQGSEIWTVALGDTGTQNPALLQAERFFTNGSTNGAATSLGTFGDMPYLYQDTNGSIYVGVTVHDTKNNGVTYQGLLGKYIAQTLATTGASTLTSVFAFVTLMILALFAF